MQKIHTTPRRDIRPLGLRGQLVINLHQQIVRLILKRTGRQELALLLAEPQLHQAREEIAWYTPATGPVERLAEAAPDVQARVRARLDELTAELTALAAELRTKADETGSSDAELLEAVLRVADPDSIFFAGEQPILVNWACDPVADGRRPVDLTRVVAVPALRGAEAAAGAVPPGVAMAPPLVIRERRSLNWGRIWPWLLALLLLLLILFLLFTQWKPEWFGTALPDLTAPPVPAERPLADAIDEEQALRQEIAELERRLALACATCPAPRLPLPDIHPEPPKPPPPPPPVIEPPKPVIEPPKLEDLPKPRAEAEPVEPPKPEPPKTLPPKPAPPPPEPPKPQPPKANPRDMVIPPDAAKRHDTSFLAGCWNGNIGVSHSGGGHMSSDDQLCFRADGRSGVLQKHLQNGAECDAIVHSSFDSSGNLVIDTGEDTSCSDGSVVYHRTYRCPPGTGAATCQAQQPSINHNYSVQFRRQKE